MKGNLVNIYHHRSWQGVTVISRTRAGMLLSILSNIEQVLGHQQENTDCLSEEISARPLKEAMQLQRMRLGTMF